jgi:hypothetical protein
LDLIRILLDFLAALPNNRRTLRSGNLATCADHLCNDDDLRTLALREAVLRSERFNVLSVSKGLDGIALAKQHHIDVVVLDRVERPCVNEC